MLVAAIIFATVYRIYFSRAVTLTQVCEKFSDMQNGEAGDMFNRMGDTSDSLNDINRLCQLRRPVRQSAKIAILRMLAYAALRVWPQRIVGDK